MRYNQERRKRGHLSKVTKMQEFSIANRGITMNILFFLTPKSEVAYLYNDDTIRQALEKMEYHRYSSIPMIDKNGKYVGAITEGDLLWYIKNKGDLNLHSVENLSIREVKRKKDNRPVYASSKMEDLFTTAMKQNFVPVIDDDETFIGIITRKDIISFMFRKFCESET